MNINDLKEMIDGFVENCCGSIPVYVDGELAIAIGWIDVDGKEVISIDSKW